MNISVLFYTSLLRKNFSLKNMPAPDIDQDTIDDIWRIFDEIQQQNEVKPVEMPDSSPTKCKHLDLLTDSSRGNVTCVDCGLVVSTLVYSEFVEDSMIRDTGRWGSKGTYKPHHHVAERMAQLQCNEPSPPLEFMDAIKAYFKSRPKEHPTKRTIRKVIKQVRMSGQFPKARKYVENWIRIRFHVLDKSPIQFKPECIRRLMDTYPLIRALWELVRPAERKCSINYNFMFVRIFQHMNYLDPLPYLPLMKKAKIEKYDTWWKAICEKSGGKLKYLPLPPRKCFYLRN
jgi:hypothetical protein